MEAHERLLQRFQLSKATTTSKMARSEDRYSPNGGDRAVLVRQRNDSTTRIPQQYAAMMRKVQCPRSTRPSRSSRGLSLWRMLTTTASVVVLLLSLSSKSHADPQMQAPRFTTQPSSSGSMVNEGRTKILQCHALGYPQPMYRWLKNGIPVGDFDTSQYLKIQSTTRDDAGSYQCLAKNDAGTIFSEKIDVVVAYMGIFEDLSEQVVSVRSGYPAILNLSRIESVPAPSVTWQTEDGPLNYDIKYATTAGNQLIILSVDENDTSSPSRLPE